MISDSTLECAPHNRGKWRSGCVFEISGSQSPEYSRISDCWNLLIIIYLEYVPKCPHLLCFFWNEVAQSNKKQPQEPFERISWFLILTHWKTYQGARSARGCGIDGVWAPQRWGDVIVRWEDLSWWFETSMISTEQFSVDFSKVFPSNSLKLSVILGPKSMSSVEIKAWTHCTMFCFFSVNSQGLYKSESSSYPTVPRLRCKDKIKLCVNRNLFWAFGKWVNLAKLSFELKQAFFTKIPWSETAEESTGTRRVRIGPFL